MKQIYYLFIASVLFFGVSSCNTNKEKEEIKTSDTISTEDNREELVLNPPHGQPGHICEIPVGQPLPASMNNTSKAPAPINLQTQLIKSNLKINPPHGEPGHRCDIPVGKALP